MTAHVGYVKFLVHLSRIWNWRKDILECYDNMAFWRDRVRLFSVCRQIVISPEDFRLRGTRRESWRSGWIWGGMRSCSDDAAHWTTRLWCEWSHLYTVCLIESQSALSWSFIDTYHVTLMTASTVALFDQFRQEIDHYNDTRERLIKVFFNIRRAFCRTWPLERLAAMSPIFPRKLFFFYIVWH